MDIGDADMMQNLAENGRIKQKIQEMIAFVKE